MISSKTDIILLSKITATPAFPKSYVLVPLTSKAYKDLSVRETNAQYETELALPSRKLMSLTSKIFATNFVSSAAFVQ